MKGPNDSLLDNQVYLPSGDTVELDGSQPVAKEARTVEKPLGGKALQRLLLFTQERGLPVASKIVAQGEKARDATEEEPKSKRKRNAAEEETPSAAPAADETADETVVVNYAQALIDAADFLQGNARGVQLAAPASNTGQAISLSPPTGIGPQWRFLGPYMMPNGQTYGDTRVVVSGRIAAIAVDPSNSNHVLCGSAGGGVWETRDRGATWAPRTDYMPTTTVGALAFNPSAPTTVYCGTGEGNFYRGQGAGVLRSTDGGTTWSVLAGNPFIGQGFYDLIVDRANGNHLLAATNGGIYESSNGGVAWTLRRAAWCWDLAMAPAGGAAAEVLAACSDGLYRSNNGGTSYTKVTLPGSPASFSRLAVAIASSNPAVAYAFGASGTTAYLYQRSAAGAWASIPLPAGLSTGQAWYDWFLAVSIDNANQIYLGAIEAYRGTFSGGAWAWVTISNKAGDDIHPDQHAVALDPANADVIYVGCDGGLFTSNNRGINWTTLNNGLGITEIEYLAHDIGSSRWLMAGTQDNGTTRYTGSGTWDHVADGDGGDCGSNRTNPNIVYHTYYGMGMERSTTKGNFGSFAWIGPDVPAGYNALFYPPVEVNNDTVAMAGQSVYISRNQGTAWTEVALAAGVASAMYLPNPNTVFVGTTDGRLYRITWSGAAWSAATALTAPRAGAYMSDVFVDPGNLNRIWATFTSLGGSRVFRSDNGGTSWIDRTPGLPALPISAIEVQPGNPNRAWVAADVGVYQTFDGGNTWNAFANGLPNALAVDLLYHPHARVLRVALRNRGVWEIPVDGWLTAPVCGVQWNGTLNPNQTLSWFTFNWPATWHVLWTVMPLTPAPGAKLGWKVAVERSSSEFVTYWITVTNLTNQVVNFEGRYAILSYY